MSSNISSDKALYRQFCREEKNLPIFFQPWYLEATCGSNWSCLVYRENPKLLAIYPYMLEKRGPFKRISMPPLVRFMGPYFSTKALQADKKHKILQQFLDRLPGAVSGFEQHFHYQIINCLPFHWAGFKQKTRFSYRVEGIDNLDQTFANLTGNYRRKIRKAGETLRAKKAENLSELYELASKSYSRQGLPFPVSEQFLAQFDATIAANQARHLFLISTKEGVPCAAAYLLVDSNTAYLLLLGEDPAYRHLECSLYTIWHTICFASEVLHLKDYDFLGSMKKSIAKVRRDFGAVPIPYHSISRNTRTYELIQWFYRLKS